MPSKEFSFTLFVAIVALASLLTGASAAAQEVRTLHSFLDNGRDGYGPLAGLTFDPSGNLYGTTSG